MAFLPIWHPEYYRISREREELFDAIDENYEEKERLHTGVWPFTWETVVWEKLPEYGQKPVEDS